MKRNYLNRNERIKTKLQVGLIYVLIDSMVALIVNWNEVLIWFKELF